VRRSRDLTKFRDAFWRRTDRLSNFASSIAGETDPMARRATSFITIEAYNAWVNFEREFYLSCAYLRPRQIGGGRVRHMSRSVTDEQSAIRHAIPVAKGRRATVPRRGRPIRPADEPDWSRREVLLSLASNLSNETEIQNGLSLQTTFFRDLPTIRIFYAHRTKSTADKVRSLALRQYGVVDLNSPDGLVNAVLPNRPNTLLEEWLADMQVIADGICA
jgi:hypothetical protein